MKTIARVLALFLSLAGGLQAQPYVMLSTGSANYSSPTIGSQTKRRDALGVGYALNDGIAIEAAYFQIQGANYTPDLSFAPGQVPASYTVQAREKKSGYFLGPVFRWKVADQLTVFTKQSLASVRTDAATVSNTGATTNWSYTDWGYQPSIGAQLKPLKDSPLGLGVELAFLLTERNRVKRLTTISFNISYGL